MSLLRHQFPNLSAHIQDYYNTDTTLSNHFNVTAIADDQDNATEFALRMLDEEGKFTPLPAYLSSSNSHFSHSAYLLGRMDHTVYFLDASRGEEVDKYYPYYMARLRQHDVQHRVTTSSSTYRNTSNAYMQALSCALVEGVVANNDMSRYDQMPMTAVVIEQCMNASYNYPISLTTPERSLARYTPTELAPAFMEVQRQNGGENATWLGIPIYIDGIYFGFLRSGQELTNQTLFFQTAYMPLSYIDEHRCANSDLRTQYHEMCNEVNWKKAFTIINAVVEAVAIHCNCDYLNSSRINFGWTTKEMTDILVDALPHELLTCIYPDMFVLNWHDVKHQELTQQYKTEQDTYSQALTTINYSTSRLRTYSTELRALELATNQEDDINLLNISNPHVGGMRFAYTLQGIDLIVQTEPLTLTPTGNEHVSGANDGFDIGEYTITVPLSHHNTEEPRSIIIESVRGGISEGFNGLAMHHPHVFHDGKPCFGNFGDAISSYLHEGEIGGLIDVLIMFLQQADSNDSAGQHWTKFFDSDLSAYNQIRRMAEEHEYEEYGEPEEEEYNDDELETIFADTPEGIAVEEVPVARDARPQPVPHHIHRRPDTPHPNPGDTPEQVMYDQDVTDAQTGER